jgi:GT2 family glycosyltransferase
MKRLSVVLPFYYKLNEFKYAFPHNKRFLTEDMELVFSVDEPDSGFELRNYLEKQSLPCSYVIKENPNKHEWRNHAKATNVGIKNSSGEYIIVMSPESICVSNVYSILVDQYKETKEKTGIDSIHIGRVAFCKDRDMVGELNDIFKNHFRTTVYRGSMCLHRDILYKIKGFDENFKYWGGEDDDMRYRLKMLGHGEPVKVWSAKLIHYEKENTRVINKDFVFKPPVKTDINMNSWGLDF